MFTYWIRFLYGDGSIAPGWRVEIWSSVGRSDGGVTDRNGWVELQSLYDSVTVYAGGNRIGTMDAGEATFHVS